MTLGRMRAVVAAVVVVPLLAYPLVVRASGSPSFPGDRGECERVSAPDRGDPLELVAAHLPSFDDAEALRERLGHAGFSAMRVEPDGCGRWKVTTGGIGPYAEGEDAVLRLRASGVDARLEVDPTPPSSG